MRVVSLTCSNTEIVCALGRSADLVGCDDHSDHPEEVVASLPRVGRDLQIDPEKVAALAPDLVLASLTVPGHEKVIAALAREKLPMLVLAPSSLKDTYADIELVARVLGVPQRGVELVAQMRREIGPPVSVERAQQAPRVLVEWWPKPSIVAGGRSWVDDLVLAAGGRNAAAGLDCESTPLDLEQARALDPEAIVISWCGVPLRKYRPEVVYRRSGWETIPAVRNGRVYCVTEAVLGRPGPRLSEGVCALRQVVSDIRQDRARALGTQDAPGAGAGLDSTSSGSAPG